MRWYDALPAGFVRALLVAEAGLTPDQAADAAAARPARNAERLPPGLRAVVGL